MDTIRERDDGFDAPRSVFRGIRIFAAVVLLEPDLQVLCEAGVEPLRFPFSAQDVDVK